VAGDDLSVASTGVFSDKNAATGKTVSLANTLGGADLDNYSVTAQTSTTADIAKKIVAASYVGVNKVEDGTVVAVAVGALDGVFVQDNVVLSYQNASFDTPTVGLNKLVSVNGVGLLGSDAANYALSQSVVLTTASITSGQAGPVAPASAVNGFVSPTASAASRVNTGAGTGAFVLANADAEVDPNDASALLCKKSNEIDYVVLCKKSVD
jgi:hypothetical protein